MDYTRHRFEREVRRRSQLDGEHAEAESEPHMPSNDLSGSESSPTSQRLKGILKTPTVRFKLSEDEPDEATFNPDFIPPPPSMNGKPPGGLPSALYDRMPPPPPGPPLSLDIFAPTADGTTKINPAAVALYTKFMDELAEFVWMQAEVIRSRVAVQEKRTLLKLYRENVSRCDVEFMKCLRESMAKGTAMTDKRLEKLFEASVTARDDVGPEEDDYEALELKLGADEFALKEKFDSLESRYENFFKLRVASTTNRSIPSSIEFEPPTTASDSSGKAWEGQEPRQHSLFQGRYIGERVKVGQLPLAVDDPAVAALVTAPTPPSNEGPPSGVNNSSDTPAHSRKRRGIADNALEDGDAQQLEDLLGLEPEESDDVPEFDPLETRMSIGLRGMVDLPTIMETPERMLEELNTDYSFGDGDSLLLLGSDTDTQSTLSDYLLRFESTRNRVNRWLLHRLRQSPREVFDLRRQVLEGSHLIPDWANLALDLWEGDSTERDPEESVHHAQPVPAPYPSTKDIPRRHRRRNKAYGSPHSGRAQLRALSKEPDASALIPNVQGV